MSLRVQTFGEGAGGVAPPSWPPPSVCVRAQCGVMADSWGELFLVVSATDWELVGKATHAGCLATCQAPHPWSLG